MLAMRDRSDSAVESSELRVEELKLALDDAHEQILELTFERDAMDQATQKVNRVASQTERDIRIQLERAIEENMKLRETTVAGEREKAERALSGVVATSTQNSIGRAVNCGDQNMRTPKIARVLNRHAAQLPDDHWARELHDARLGVKNFPPSNFGRKS